jgi:hypothetical protein
LKNESNAGIDAVVADVEGKQALAFADCIEDDRTTVLPEIIAAEPQLLNHLRDGSVSKSHEI